MNDPKDGRPVSDLTRGLDFIEALRPAEFRRDYREDYEDRQPDGTHKRTRFHQGLIAQEVAEVCDTLGIDFAGLQHAARNGGDDVWSLGYGELITPLVSAVQTLSAQNRDLEKRLAALEARMA